MVIIRENYLMICNLPTRMVLVRDKLDFSCNKHTETTGNLT